MDNESSKPIVNISSINQSGGITAQTVIYDKPRRQISTDWPSNSGFLQKVPTSKVIDVSVDRPTEESYSCAKLICKALEANGYKVGNNGEPISFTGFYPGPPPKGIKAYINSDPVEIIVFSDYD